MPTATESAVTGGTWTFHHGCVVSDVKPANSVKKATPVASVSVAYKSSAERDANGRLLAAAKEMLAALEMVQKAAYQASDQRRAELTESKLLVIDAAVAKAKGEQ